MRTAVVGCSRLMSTGVTDNMPFRLMWKLLTSTLCVLGEGFLRTACIRRFLQRSHGPGAVHWESLKGVNSFCHTYITANLIMLICYIILSSAVPLTG